MEPTFPLPRLVYLFGDGSIFDEVISWRLSRDRHLQISRYLHVEEATFLANVRLVCPGAIVINESTMFSFERIVMMISQLPLPADLRMIVIKSGENIVNIYDRQASQPDIPLSMIATHLEISGWNEIFDLVEGKQVTA